METAPSALSPDGVALFEAIGDEDILRVHGSATRIQAAQRGHVVRRAGLCTAPAISDSAPGLTQPTPSLSPEPGPRVSQRAAQPRPQPEPESKEDNSESGLQEEPRPQPSLQPKPEPEPEPEPEPGPGPEASAEQELSELRCEHRRAEVQAAEQRAELAQLGAAVQASPSDTAVTVSHRYTHEQKLAAAEDNVSRGLRAAVYHDRLLHGRTLVDVQAVFRAMDADHSGRLSFEELDEALDRLDIVLGPGQLREVFEAADSDADGKIDFDEFTHELYIRHGVQPQPRPTEEVKPVAPEPEPGPEPEPQYRKMETLRDAMERVGGFGEEEVSKVCEYLDIVMVRSHRDDEAFWADIKGAEWAMQLDPATLPRLANNLPLLCDRDWVAEEAGRLVPVAAALLDEATARAGGYWPFPSFRPAELRVEPAHRRRERVQAKTKLNMRKMRVLGRMSGRVALSMDAGAREKQARIDAKRAAVRERQEAEKARIAAAEAAAVEAMGLEALGSRPLADPGPFHCLVNGDEVRIPVLEETDANVGDARAVGKASSFYSYAPPMRDDLHRDELRKQRVAMVDHRYDFTYADRRSRAVAWRGQAAGRQALVRKGYSAVMQPKHLRSFVTREARASSISRAEGIAQGRQQQRRQQRQGSSSGPTSTSQRPHTAAGVQSSVDEDNWALFQSGWSQDASTNGVATSHIEDTAAEKEKTAASAAAAAAAAEEEGGEVSAGVAQTQSMFELADTTHLPDGACYSYRRETTWLRPRSEQREGLRQLQRWQQQPIEDIVASFRGQPLAARGALRTLRHTPERPFPGGRGNERTFPDPPVRQAGRPGHFRDFDGRQKRWNSTTQRLYPRQVAGGAQLPPKPHWDRPVMVSDYMPTRTRRRSPSVH